MQYQTISGKLGSEIADGSSEVACGWATVETEVVSRAVGFMPSKLTAKEQPQTRRFYHRYRSV